MVEVATAEQDRRAQLEPWFVGNSAHDLMRRLSEGVVKLDGYAQAVAAAHAATNLLSSPIDQNIRFSQDGLVQYAFQNSRSLSDPMDEGGRVMYLEIKDRNQPPIKISLRTQYRVGLGLYNGSIIINDHNPEAERLPPNTLLVVDRIREIFDKYLPLEPQNPSNIRRNIMEDPQAHHTT